MTIETLKDGLNGIYDEEILNKEIYLLLENRSIVEEIVGVCETEFVIKHNPDEADSIFEEVCDKVANLVTGRLTSVAIRKDLFDVDTKDAKVYFLSESDY